MTALQKKAHNPIAHLSPEDVEQLGAVQQVRAGVDGEEAVLGQARPGRDRRSHHPGLELCAGTHPVGRGEPLVRRCHRWAGEAGQH